VRPLLAACAVAHTHRHPAVANLRRQAAAAGLSERAWRSRVRVAYAKVAEFQARGLVHFHAIIRLDAATDRALAPGLHVTAEQLCDAIRKAVKQVRLQGHGGGGDVLELRFGKQLHTRILRGAENGVVLEPEAVAAYVAKYSCKGSHDTITRAGAGPDQLRQRGVPEQLVQMAVAVLRLADRPGLAGLGRWVHMLGFRGHFVTKSRGYSTTLGALRHARAAYRADQHDQPTDEASTVVVAAWDYVGSGYLNPGDALLAAGVEASLRTAREARLDQRLAQ
jgi:replication initiator protein RepSA